MKLQGAIRYLAFCCPFLAGAASAQQLPRSYLRTGDVMNTGQYMVSDNRAFYAVMQGDGNLCVYKGSGPGDTIGYLWCNMVTAPGGAFYAWPNVTEACRRIGVADSEEFRKRLLAEAGVAVLADIHFGARVPGEGQHVRFSYAASKQAIEAGVARMADFIRKNTKKAA